MNRNRILVLILSLALLAAALVLYSNFVKDSVDRGDGVQPEESSPGLPAAPDTAYSNIAPDYVGKPIPDLATWRDEAPSYPPTGEHRKKMVRYSLKEVLGIELPASAYDFHYAGYFRMPLEDCRKLYDDLIAVLQLDPETLTYNGPPPKVPIDGFKGNDHVYFPGGGHRFKTARPARNFMLPFSEGTVSIRFVERKTGMQFSFTLDPKTGNCSFGKGRYD